MKQKQRKKEAEIVLKLDGVKYFTFKQLARPQRPSNDRKVWI